MSNHKGTLLLIRGLLREQQHWGDFIPLLKNALPHYQIVTLDTPGNGTRCQVPSPLSISRSVDDLRYQLHLQRYTAPLHLLGLSMGGMMVVDWLQRYPAEVTSATLINSSFRRFSPFYHRFRSGLYPQILRAFGLSIADREAFILGLTANDFDRRQATLANWISIARQHPIKRYNAIRQIIAAARFVPKRQRPVSPLMLLASQADRIVNIQCSQTIAQQWQLPLHIHPSAGHDLPLDAPDWVADQLQHWLKLHS